MPYQPRKHNPCPGPTHKPLLALRRRRSSAQRGYSYAWQKLRLAFLHAHPLCHTCCAIATEVDHHDNDQSNNDWSNLTAMCKSCHSKKTQREDRRR